MTNPRLSPYNAEKDVMDMLDEKDLQAIGQMMDTQEKKLSAMMDTKLAETEQRILDESTRRMNILLENVVTPKFSLLAENQRDILEKLVPRVRVDELEDEVKFLKVIVRQMNEDIQNLKKAN